MSDDDTATRQLLTVSQLSHLTGATKATIHHYVNENLLPAPLKTAKNMAYYKPECIGIIKLVKKLRERDIPIKTIRELLASQSIEWIEELLNNSSLFYSLPVNLIQDSQVKTSPNELDNLTFISDSDLKELLSLDLIAQNPDGSYDWLSLALLKTLNELKSSGLTEPIGFHTKDVVLYKHLAEQLLNTEISYFLTRLPNAANPLKQQILQSALRHAELLFVLIRRRILLNMLSDTTSTQSDQIKQFKLSKQNKKEAT